MAKKENRERVANMIRKKWRDGKMEHLRKIFSETIKKTRRLGKIKSVIRSKKEKNIIKEIEKLGYAVNHSLKVDTKICDIYIPVLNLVIEFNGDYWHCNPEKYNSNYFHQVKQKTAQELWDYDRDKVDLIKEKGYNLEVVWESQLKKNPKLINQIIKKYDTRE